MAQKGTGKTLEKLKASVNDGKYYEAHQMYRTIARRYNKQQKYDNSIKLLHDGALSLFQHNQFASDRIIDFLNFIPPLKLAVKLSFPKVLGKKNLKSWTQKNGQYSEGDPELHDYVGTLFYEEKNYSLAEEHLLVGTDHSAELLGKLSYEWAEHDTNNGKGLYVARVVLQYLAMKGVHHATLAFNSFLKVAASNAPVTDHVDFRYTPAGDITKVPTYEDSWLNFTQLVLLTVQRDASNMFVQLKSTYGSLYQSQKGFDDLIDDIGAAFFNIQKPRKQGNIMQDLMNSLFAGGPPPGPSSGAANNANKQVTGSPSLGLD
ncbi:unnamed protein product [Cunninghamella echinulata]